ncbi:MAG: hypothetical protein IJU23_08980 [Proteobacteria bacterium]|nr:hypothetical protein [Pseudomonadota bacterium]
MKKLILISSALVFIIPATAFADLGPRPPQRCDDFCVKCYDCKTYHQHIDPGISHVCRHHGCSCTMEQRKKLCKALEESQAKSSKPVVCGDGVVTGNEVCDEGSNKTAGCNNCLSISFGWKCDNPGAACTIDAVNENEPETNAQPQNDSATTETKDAQTGTDNTEIKDAQTGTDNTEPVANDLQKDSTASQDSAPVQDANSATPAPTPNDSSPAEPPKASRSCTAIPYEQTATPLAILLMFLLLIIGLALPARKQ